MRRITEKEVLDISFYMNDVMHYFKTIYFLRYMTKLNHNYAEKNQTQYFQFILQGDPHFFDSLFRLTEEENAWDTIASYKYYFDEKFDMLVGITKEADIKQPWKSYPGQYATQFLPIRFKLEKDKEPIVAETPKLANDKKAKQLGETKRPILVFL